MRTLAAISVLLLLGGCSIAVKMPASRFDSPETVGAGQVKLGAAIGGTEDVVLTQDFVSSAPNTQSPAFDHGVTAFLDAGFGVTDWIDVEGRSDLSLHVKAQLVGRPRSEAKKGNFSVAVAAAAGLLSDSGNGGSEAAQAQYSYSGPRYDASALVGYRALDWLMVFGNGSYSYGSFSGSYQNTKLNPANGSFRGTAISKTVAVGVELGIPRFLFKLEGSTTDVSSGSGRGSRICAGTEIAFLFGHK